MVSKQFIVIPALLLLFCLSSCIFNGRETVEPKEGEPTKYYLHDNDELSLEPGPLGSWNYITAYIYPSGSSTSKSWRTYLTKNISGPSFGYDLTVRSNGDVKLRIELILEHEDVESILVAKDFNIPGTEEGHAIGLKDEAEWTNPKSGKGDFLIFRMKHISGTERIEIYFDGGLGYAGNTYITVPLL